LEVSEVSILALVAKNSVYFNHCRRKSKVYDSTINEIMLIGP